MSMMIQRAVVRTVLVCAALAGLAAMHNHVTQPCQPTEVGAAGMCVTTQIGGA